ncbi:MAG: GNAT family N-acetyltransferase [Pseudomonadota bacterium]
MPITFRSHPNAGWGIRLFKSTDSGGVRRVFDRCLREFPWRGSITEEWRNLKRTLKGSDIFVSEEPQAGIVGFMVINLSTGYISHVFVEMDWRFCGIGRGFLDIARDMTGKPLTLDVDEANTAAVDAYEALGWHVVAPTVRPPGVTYRQIRMVSP